MQRRIFRKSVPWAQDTFWIVKCIFYANSSTFLLIFYAVLVLDVVIVVIFLLFFAVCWSCLWAFFSHGREIILALSFEVRPCVSSTHTYCRCCCCCPIKLIALFIAKLMFAMVFMSTHRRQIVLVKCPCNFSSLVQCNAAALFFLLICRKGLVLWFFLGLHFSLFKCKCVCFFISITIWQKEYFN